jgi:hypothetical protein
MTLRSAARAESSVRCRGLSNDLFGRSFQLEIAFAAAALTSGFTLEELESEIRARAIRADLEPPKSSAVRTGVHRLMNVGVIIELSSPRPGVPTYYQPAPNSSFWPFVMELMGRL